MPNYLFHSSTLNVLFNLSLPTEPPIKVTIFLLSFQHKVNSFFLSFFCIIFWSTEKKKWLQSWPLKAWFWPQPWLFLALSFFLLFDSKNPNRLPSFRNLFDLASHQVCTCFFFPFYAVLGKTRQYFYACTCMCRTEEEGEKEEEEEESAFCRRCGGPNREQWWVQKITQ